MRLIDAEQIGLTDMEIILCDGNYKKALEMLIDKIANAPSIDAVPVKHGRWTLECGNGHFATYKYHCSECGTYHRARYDYCPTCGARMDAETCNNTEEKLQ